MKTKRTPTTPTTPTTPPTSFGLASLAGMPRGLHFDDPKKTGDGGGGGGGGGDANPGLSEKQREELDELLNPLKKQSTENSEALAKIGGSIEELTKAVQEGGGKPKDDPKGGGKDSGGDDIASAVAAAVTEALKPHTERLDAIEAEKTAGQENAAARERVTAYLKAKRPGLLVEKYKAVVDRIVGLKPADDDAVKAAVKSEVEYLATTSGADPEKLGVDPEGEGAKETGDGDGKTKEEKLQRIRDFKTPSLT